MSNDAKSFLTDSVVRSAFTGDDPVGYSVEGFVCAEPELKQQWTYVSPEDAAKGVKSEPDFWPPAKWAKPGDEPQPKQHLIVDVETDLEEGNDDDGTRRMFVKFKLQQAFKAGLRKAKIRDGLHMGDWVKVTYVGRETDKPEGSRAWMTAPKLWEVEVRRDASAARTVEAAFLGDDKPAERVSRVVESGDVDDDERVAGTGGARTSGGRQPRPTMSEAQRAALEAKGISV